MSEIPADIWDKAIAVENDNDGAGPTACVMNIARAILAERERTEKEISHLRHRVRAKSLSDEEITAEMAEMERAFAARPDCGGSPGEWAVERMDELETEIKRRSRERLAAAIRAR